MHLSYISEKYKIILRTTPVFQEELAEFYTHIPMEEIEVIFMNPFTGLNQTIATFRGDRKASMLWDLDHIGRLYDSVEQSFIEL